ncbi:MAG: hypothetical protein QXD32_04560, partial [Nitrososphaerota archaeon]
DRTYTPSELGIAGVDDYYAALAAIKYIQAHTSLGNDFVSLWGRPDKPALYVTGTTRTDTYTVTTTTTSVTATTTTRTRTTTSYTTTWTSRTTRESAPYLRASYGCDNVIFFTFRANGWGTAPYFIAIYRNDRLIGSVMTSGSWHGSAEPFIGNEGWTVVVTDVMGRQAVWSGQYSQPSSCNPPPTTTQPPTTTPPGPTTSPPTTQPPGTTTVWLTDTVTVTSFVYVGGATYTTVTVTATSTNYRYVTVTTTYTNTDLYKVTATQTHTMPYVYTTEVTVTMYAGNPIVALSARSLRPICSVPELRLTPSGGSPAVVGWRAVAETLAVLGALYTVGARRRVWQYLAMAALIAMMAWALEPRQASGLSIQDVITYKTTVTITVTSTVSVTGGTYTYVSTSWVAVTSTVTETHVEIVTTTTTVTTYVTVTEWTAISTVTNTVHPCRCRGLWSCEAPC